MADSGGSVKFRRIRSVSVSFEFDSARVSQDGFEPKGNECMGDPGCYSKSLGYDGRTHSYGSILRETAGHFTSTMFSDLVNFMRNKCFNSSNKNSCEFHDLPDHVKLMIFSNLSCKTLGVALCVCKDWNLLIRNPSVWTNIDFTEFNFCLKSHVKQHRECSMLCYHDYANRMKTFMNFLISIKPIVKHLKFSFDIGDPDDGWRELLPDLLKSCRLKDLRSADINWTETVFKKAFVSQSTSATWSHSDLKDLTSRRRLRQRYFIRLFDLFTAVAPNMEELHLPFDWSEKSIEAFSRLSSLKVLELKKYFAYGVVMPEEFSRFLRCFPRLEKLSLELWSENYGGFRLYQISSSSLVDLDISQCRGVYFNVIDAPKLKTYRTSRVLTQWPFDNPNFVVDPPCMYRVLAAGAPNLTTLNDLDLAADWKNRLHPDLERLLSEVCFCRAHIRSET